MSQNFKVYKSSAGSGKTTTLVMDYLAICIPKPNAFKSIMAITFTIKATQEMKTRVLEVLQDIIDSEGQLGQIPQIIFQKIQLQDVMSSEAFVENSKTLLRNILHMYSYFNFSTIDSFVVKIVKAYAFDLGLPLNFDIELDSNKLLDEAVAAMFDQVGYDDVLTKNLYQFVKAQFDNEKDIRIDKQIVDLSKSLFNDGFEYFNNEIKALEKEELQEFKRTVFSRERTFRNELQAAASKAIQLLEDHNLSMDDLSRKKSGIYGYFLKISILKDLDKLGPNSYALKAIHEDVWLSNAKRHLESQLAPIKGSLIAIFQECEKLRISFLSYYSLKNSILPAYFLNEIAHELQLYYQEHSSIPLAETISSVSKISSKEQMPFIFERVGNAYKNLLIDEFQDTSSKQWLSLLPIVENALAEDHFNLIVGDAKQAIYAWRGGDFRQFVHLPEIAGSNQDALLKMREAILQRNYDEHRLEHNYRSAPEVVQFNNHLFDMLKSKNGDLFSQVFESHTQKPTQKQGGRVELFFLKKEDDPKVHIPDYLAEKIHDALNRGYSCRDIAVLSRKKKSLKNVAEILVSHNIPVISQESFSLNSSPSILFLIHLLKWVQNPENAVAHYAATQFLLDTKRIEDRQMLMESFDFNEWCKRLGNADWITYAEQNQWIMLLKKMSIYFGLFDEEFPFMIHLIDFARQAEQTYGFGLDNFLRYCDENLSNECIEMPDGLDAVSLLTVHKSKGMEFPVVILMDDSADSKMPDFFQVHLEPLGFSKPGIMLVKSNKILNDTVFAQEYQDYLEAKSVEKWNILYVAFTRPRYELYYIGTEKGVFYDELDKFARGYQDFDFNEETGIAILGNLESQRKNKSEAQTKEESIVLKEHHLSTLAEKQISGLNIESNASLFRRTEGIHWHKLLSFIYFEEDIDAAVEQGIRLGLLDEKDKAMSLNKLQEIVQFAPQYFSKEYTVYNEKSLINIEHEILQPDRVLVSPQEVLIIDYKYSNSDEVEDKQRNRYHSQLKMYRNALQKMYPDRKLSSQLYWIKDSLHIETVQ